MPTIANPADWCISRLREGRPFFAVRFNDGEHTGMYRTRPEGVVLGTDANPATLDYAWGDALNAMLAEMAAHSPEDVLIGCSWNTPRADELAQRFAADVGRLGMGDFNWCNEHWPLDGVVDGSTVRLLETIRKERPYHVVLVTSTPLFPACHCLGATITPVPAADSWGVRNQVHESCQSYAEKGYLFIWAAGVGLKPTAWRLWREFPQSTHLDVGHLFNGAFGLTDYGWLQRKDGPWHEPYFRDFAPWVRSFLP